MKTAKKSIVILGAGFGGTYTAIGLQRLLRHRPDIELTLVSRDNYHLMTPLLFEAGSGVLEPRHAVTPLRSLLKEAHFVQGDVDNVDFETRKVHLLHRSSGARFELDYDNLIIALGVVTNTKLVAGSEQALTFKSLHDAIYLRNRVIDLFEQATVEPNRDRRRQLLSFTVVGGGLVGVELTGELHSFIEALTKSYAGLSPEEITFRIVEAGSSLVPELPAAMGQYAKKNFEKLGIEVLVGKPVDRIEPGAVFLKEGRRLDGETIIYAAGITATPLVASFDLEKDKKGRIAVDATMRSRSRPEVWALGDCAAIPKPEGGTYPALAQHALREAKVLAANVAASLDGGELTPFRYKSQGTMALLGGFRGMGNVLGIPIRGLLAWWVWRTYYLLRMPRMGRRVRILLDWTVGLFFGRDTAHIETGPSRVPRPERAPSKEEHPIFDGNTSSPTVSEGASSVH